MAIAIVTGASSGMGREFVKYLIQAPRNTYDEIWLIARRKEALIQLQKKYRDHNIRIFSLDLQKNLSYEVIRQALENQSVSCFIHAAGFGIMGKIEQIPMEEQIEMLDVNCKSTLALTSVILPHMQKGGNMIYLASSAAFLPQPGFAVYAASKSFVLSFVRSLRRETKDRDYKITAVCPGAVKTEFFERASQYKKMPSYKKMVMADRKKVVALAWKDNRKNKEISVYGMAMKGFWGSAKLIPHAIILHFLKG